MKFEMFYNRLPKVILEGDVVSGWQNYIDTIPMLKAGVELLHKIEEIGGENSQAYIVGGTIRDIITGDKEPDDIDIATSVPIDEIEKHFKTHDIGKNKDFGIIVITYKGYDFEIANYRKDGKYSDGRRPESVEIVLDFKTDAERRDFTINAMGVDKDGNIIDYFDGKNDIKNKILRTVGDPNKRFGEDFLRMLRAVRFASRMDFDIDSETMSAIKNNAENIENISKERVMKELNKMADQEGPKFAKALEMLDDAGLLKYILPEVFKLKDMPHSPEHHPESPNVLGHVLSALRSNPVKDKLINLSILFHDIGKLDTHHVGDDELHHYFGHAKASSDLIDKLADRLKIDNKTKETLKFSALNHMKMHNLLDMSNNKIIRMMEDPNWDILVSVAKADSMSRGDLFNEKEWNDIENKIAELRNRFDGIQSLKSIKKIVNGNLIMKLKPTLKTGPEIGKIIKNTIDYVLNNNINIESEFDKVSDFIKNQ